MSTTSVLGAVEALVKSTNDAIGDSKPSLFFNDEKVPDQSGNWLRVSIMTGDSKPYRGGSGVSGNLVSGVLHLSFFGIPARGEGELTDLADVFRPVFSKTKIGIVNFFAPSLPKKIQDDPSWLQLVVECPFDYEEP